MRGVVESALAHNCAAGMREPHARAVFSPAHRDLGQIKQLQVALSRTTGDSTG
jgi:hypothetical protein